MNDQKWRVKLGLSRVRLLFLEWLEEARSGEASAFVAIEPEKHVAIEDLLDLLKADTNRVPADYCVSFGWRIGSTYTEAAEDMRTRLME